MRRPESLGFDHKKLPLLAFHLTPKGKTPGALVSDGTVGYQGYHGHAYMINPKAMTRKEFATAIRGVARERSTSRDIVVIQPSKGTFESAGVRAMHEVFQSQTPPVMSGGFHLMKEAVVGYRGVMHPNVLENMKRGTIDKHLGDVMITGSNDADLEAREQALKKLLRGVAK